MGIRAKNKLDDLNDRQRAQIVRMYAEGYELKAIGERFGIDYKLITRHLKQVGAYKDDRRNM